MKKKKLTKKQLGFYAKKYLRSRSKKKWQLLLKKHGMSNAQSIVKKAKEIDSFRDTEADIPWTVYRYVQEHLDQGYDESYAYALAWSRYCKYKKPNSPRCRQRKYFGDQ